MRLLGPIRDGGGASKPTKRLTPNQADRQSQSAIIARDQASSLAAFRASGLGAAGFINRVDAQARAAQAPASTTQTRTGSPPPPTPTPTPTPTPEPTPTVKAIPMPIQLPPTPTYDAVKAAPIDTVVFVDESFSAEFITDLLFEDVGGQELLSIARDDTVNGQYVIYQPFKNLGILRDTYDINNLLKLQETSDRFFANFIINLFEKIPIVGNGPDGKNYYFDGTSGDVIIEFVNMRSDEQVEIQISNAGIIEEVGI